MLVEINRFDSTKKYLYTFYTFIISTSLLTSIVNDKISSLQTGQNLVPEPENEMEKLQGEGAAVFRRLPRTNPAD